MNQAPSRSRQLAITVAALAIIGLIGSLVGTARANAPGDHGQVVPEKPRLDLPVVLDGVVNASVVFHDMVVVAGEFSAVQLQDESVVGRERVMAYNINTGEFIDWFDPIVDKEVISLGVSDDGNSLFLGGRFTLIDGVTRHRVAKLDRWGEVVEAFDADVEAKVHALVDDGDRLYIGGSFVEVDGQPRSHLAALDSTTGDLDPFRNDVTGGIGWEGASSVRALDLHPDGTRLLVIHSDTHVAGLPRTGVAQIDLTTDIVSAWHTEWYKHARLRCADGEALTVRDVEYSPDGSFFVVVEKGHYECDKTIAFPTADWPGLEQNLWVTSMFDSAISVGVSDSAVYVGGHFCYTKALGPIHSDDVADYPFEDKPEVCNPFKNEDRDGFSARYQLAALDPVTGEPLDWDPTTNVQVGVYDIEVIERGLLLSLDRDQVNYKTTGRHAWIEIEPIVTEPGYYLLGESGEVFTFGGAVDRGDAQLEDHLRATAIDTTGTGDGYIVVASDWSVHPFGDAPTVTPDAGDLGQGDVPVDVRIDPLNRGYWIFSDTGRVVSVGDVPHLGDVSNLDLAGAVIAGEVNSVGDGYRMLGTDGGVFSFGTDRFLGSIPEVLPGVTLQCPIVGLVASSPNGYWLVGCDGGVFAFGDAPFVGSLPGLGVTPVSPVNAMVPYGAGYLLIAGDGGVFAFGGEFLGSLGDKELTSEIIAIAVV
ncbi:MAG: hypothetical protein GY708_03645 [Actinomycetia bacterium]|nr:hypothetical protein [Actinomycetes bacterium]